jgi:hypothetical protein
MGIEIVTFIFGGLLLLTGILGGGFEVKELKIPSVAMIPRIIASVAGLIFIIVGIAISGGDNSSDAGESDEQQQAVPVEFLVKSDLAENAISEQVVIIIDGKPVGTLTASQQHPESIITVTVPQEGSYSYSVDGSIVYDIDGNEETYTCTGQGNINVTGGKEFYLGISISGDTILVTLLE